MSFAILFAIFIDYLHDVHTPGICLLLEGSIAKLHCVSKDVHECLKSHPRMPVVKLRAGILSYFKALAPALNFLMVGTTLNINPAVFYCIWQNNKMTVMHYKVTISKNGDKLNVISYIRHRPYNMDIELFDTTDRHNFSGRLACTCMDSGDLIVTIFKIARRSPTLFNTILDYFRPGGMTDPLSNKQAPVTWAYA
jgi:hypothetical protein